MGGWPLFERWPPVFGVESLPGARDLYTTELEAKAVRLRLSSNFPIECCLTVADDG